jgi:UPF0176 protein
MLLHNRISREVLKENLLKESFARKTISFYKYIRIENPEEFRNKLFAEWNELSCFGRIYIAHEGINAQMSIPEMNIDKFLQTINKNQYLSNVPIKYAVEDNGKSFFKLIIKVRPKIVADGLDDNLLDLSKTGKHLSAIEFHNIMDDTDAVVVDMRNHYESEIGKFNNAFCTNSDTFKDAIVTVKDKFHNAKDKKLLLYCTGGIRCEKASSYLIHNGFTNVYQLNGGIIEYSKQLKLHNLKSRFIGKNFVFDERLGETIDGQVISKCHQCGKPSDMHTNCANNDCHLLFIQCNECKEKYNGCCSTECKDILTLPAGERKKFRKQNHSRYSRSKIFNTLENNG